jgi:hypothetical protein
MRRRAWVISAVAGALLLATSAGVALARGGDDQVSGPDADRARAAATKVVPGGTAGQVEGDSDEPGIAYGVEVATPDGSRVQVHLTDRFTSVAAPEGGA